MNWICDECGYEVEFNEFSRLTVCPCCDTPAPRDKIRRAKREWREHMLRKRRDRIREHWTAVLAKANNGVQATADVFFKFINITPTIHAVMIVFALALTGMTAVSSATDSRDMIARFQENAGILFSKARYVHLLNHFDGESVNRVKTLTENLSVNLNIIAGRRAFARFLENIWEIPRESALSYQNLTRDVIPRAKIYWRNMERNLTDKLINTRISWDFLRINGAGFLRRAEDNISKIIPEFIFENLEKAGLS